MIEIKGFIQTEEKYYVNPGHILSIHIEKMYKRGEQKPDGNHTEISMAVIVLALVDGSRNSFAIVEDNEESVDQALKKLNDNISACSSAL